MSCGVTNSHLWGTLWTWIMFFRQSNESDRPGGPQSSWRSYLVLITNKIMDHLSDKWSSALSQDHWGSETPGWTSCRIPLINSRHSPVSTVMKTQCPKLGDLKLLIVIPRAHSPKTGWRHWKQRWTRLSPLHCCSSRWCLHRHRTPRV